MTKKDEILLENYIEGAMTPVEKSAFKERLRNESKLAEAYKTATAAHALIKEAGRIELKKNLQSLEENKKTSKTKVLTKRMYLVAASVLLCIGFYFMQDYFTAMDSAQVYERYFEMYPAPSTLRGNETPETRHWESAVKNYVNGNYALALSDFERAESSVPNDKVAFYESLCRLQISDSHLNIALDTLRKISSENSDYSQQALWYYALGSLRKGNQEEALHIFEEIVKNKSYRYQEASKILQTKLKD